MALRIKQVVLVFLFIVILSHGITAEHEKETLQRLRTAPRRNAVGGVIDGSGTEHSVNSDKSGNEMGEWQGGNNRVSVSTVAFFTLAMAAATGLGALPFFFVELDPQWAGICNGMAAGVMLAASFDLIQEGQGHGSGSWVVLGILAGGIFIWLCKKFLEQYGEVSMLDIKGAEAAKVILVVGIMTLHSFGEGSGVGVSFAGSKGLSQGILVTLAIAVHNIPEGLAVSMVLASRGVSPQNAMLWSVITSLPQPIVAVPSFMCADAFNKFLPFATGFAAGCMIWMVMAEVLPDGFKEASPSHVASAATLSVAFMEALGAVFEHLTHNYKSIAWCPRRICPFFPASACSPNWHGLWHCFCSGSLATHSTTSVFKNGPFPTFLSPWVGSTFIHLSISSATKFGTRKRTSANTLSAVTGLSVSALTLQSVLSCVAVALHALAEGLALGVAAPKAYGLGRHMVLPVSLHGFPRGAAVASCIFGATDSWHGSLLSAALIGLVGPLSAIGAILAGIDYSGLDHVMVFACGGLFPCFWSIVRRAVKLDKRKSIVGLILGIVFASVCLTCTKLVCLHTPYCNSAPEAVR
ncbi:UNVERIFIED_CONTAM: putative zinc transporter [Sesamum calycinum]|uniref:Zinc transporter n=1 Tax=Sesamum calycinum TaxID=2727403 RepID=A0AAW2RAD0_9LAMI